jgi:hypothetical protein
MRPAVGTIEAGQVWVVAQACQPGVGGVDESGVDVNRADVAVAEPVAQQGSVVAGAGANLQYPVARMGVQVSEHARHQGWLGRGTGRHGQRAQGVAGIGLA